MHYPALYTERMPEHWGTELLLCLAALAAGIMNSIAGGGTLLTFPALLSVVPPVVANATSTVALVSGSLSGAWGYRSEIRHLGRWTGQGSIDTAVTAMKEGAYDFLTKPVDASRLKLLLPKAAEKASALREVALLRRRVKQLWGVGKLVSLSANGSS